MATGCQWMRGWKSKSTHGALLSLLLVGCPSQSAKNTEPPTPPDAAVVGVDADRLFNTVGDLASDGLGGRYSLYDTDIRRAASYIADILQGASATPIGDSYLHDFGITIGAEVRHPPRLEVKPRGKSRAAALAASEFTPLSSSPSGSVEGEVVFVGYAARAAANGSAPAYDDLEGIPLKGKIALLLREAPNKPNIRELYGALKREREAFERTAAGLRTAGDNAALAKLQVQSRTAMAAIIQPFMAGRAVPEVLLVSPEDPGEEIDISAFAAALTPEDDGNVPVFMFSESRLRTKLDRVAASGAVGVILVDGPRGHVDADAHHEDELPPLDGTSRQRRSPLPVVQMKWSAARSLFAVGKKNLDQLQKSIDTELHPMSGSTRATARIEVDIVPVEQPVPNVLGMIRGSEKPDEVIMLGAHYDHIGTAADGRGHCKAIEADGNRDEICNGADDNASGTAVVLEVARAFASARYRPKRTIVFALFAGEELGLLGSRALAEHPPEGAPWIGDGKLVGMVNIDMVGRLNEGGLLVGGVGSSPDWMSLFDVVGNHDMPILFDKSVTSRSDHASFFKLGVPVVFFFTGVHDDYHAPGDEVADINREGLASVANFTHDLMKALGDGADLRFAEDSGGLVSALPGDIETNVVRRVFGPAEAAATPQTSG